MPVSYTPIYRITKDDVDITDRFNDRCTSIQIRMTSGGGDSDTIQIVLDNRDFKLMTPDVGAKLRIDLGYKEIGMSYMGTYEINTFEYAGVPHELRITGTSVGFMTALKAPAIKHFENKTLGQIIDEIAKIGGVEPRVHSQFTNEKIPYFNQSMSPLHMLHELERRNGAIAKFSDNKLVFVPRGEGVTYSGASQPTLVLEPWMFGQYSVRFSKRTAYAKAKVSYRDASGATRWVEQENPNRQQNDNDQNQAYLYGKRMNSEAEARKQAEAVMDMLRRQECEANFTLAKGDPWIKDQCPIIVRDMFNPVNGAYVAEVVTHTYTKDQGIGTTILAKYPNTNASFEPVDPNSPLGLSAIYPNLRLNPDESNTTFSV